YMLHQQGLGFYTNPGAVPEGHIRKNPYPGMFGPQTMGFGSSFEQGWGRELERRKQLFANSNAAQGGTGPVTTASDAAAYIEAHGGHSSVMRDGRIDESGHLGAAMGANPEFYARLAAAGQAFKTATG